MASNAPESALTKPNPSSGLETQSEPSDKSAPQRLHPPYLEHLASTILFNLQHQHDWTQLCTHTHSPLTGLPLPRPLVSGRPPRRIYVHPDEQLELLKAKHDGKSDVAEHPELEWVLPTHLKESWSVRRFSEIYEAIGTVPPSKEPAGTYDDHESVGQRWRGKNRQKRVLLATLHDDSTVVYYIMHDGIVKPRQN